MRNLCKTYAPNYSLWTTFKNSYIGVKLHATCLQLFSLSFPSPLSSILNYIVVWLCGWCGGCDCVVCLQIEPSEYMLSWTAQRLYQRISHLCKRIKNVHSACLSYPELHLRMRSFDHTRCSVTTLLFPKKFHNLNIYLNIFYVY